MSKPSRTWDITSAGTVVALVMASFTFYFQFFHVRDAAIVVISDGDVQPTVPRPYERMPLSSQNDFPRYEDRYPLYALVRLVFANTGDCPGYARLLDIAATPEEFSLPPGEKLEVSNYTYVLIPPHAIVDRAIMLRNIPTVVAPAKVRVALKMETGGSCGATVPHPAASTMTVMLYPAADTPRVTAFSGQSLR